MTVKEGEKMRMLHHRCWHAALAAAALSFPAHPSASQVLVLTADAGGTECNIVAPLLTVATGFVVLKAPRTTEAQGVELSIRGLPQGWSGSFDPCPGCIVWPPIVRDFEPGASIAWAPCATGDTIPLVAVRILATSELADVTLHIDGKSPPSDPNFACPLIVLCDAPVYTRLCVQGGEGHINSTTPCTVGVVQGSWGAYKALYDR